MTANSATTAHRLQREIRARKEAEQLLEAKSHELYQSNKDLEAVSASKEAYLQVLNKFALAMTDMDDVEALVWYVAREVVGQLDFLDCVFYLFNEKSGCLVQRAAIAEKNPSDDDIANPLKIPLGQGITGHVAEHRKAEIVDDVTVDPRYISDIGEPGSEICVPVLHDGQLIGVLDSEHSKKGFFNKYHLEILQTVASYAGAKIAERRAHDEAIVRAIELEEKVFLLTKLKEELEAAKEKAEETSALKSRFVATISHEIRTPLSGILGSLDLLQDEPLDNRASELVNMARNSGQSLQVLLNDVIDFARTEAGTLQLEPTVFSIKELLDSVQGFWQPHIEAHGRALTIISEVGSNETYWGDPARIRQILNNYMSNALKYAGESDFVLRVSHEDTTENCFKFEVIDYGPGLTEEDQKQLFQEFTRVGPHKRQIGEGAGLGLAICKQVAELMHGTVGVESGVEAGSTFWLVVPLKPAEARQKVKRKSATFYKSFKSLIGRRPRILVAEDVPANQTIIRMTLEAFDCRVTIVNNGVEAVEAARTHDYDMIFMDIAMPQMDGTAATLRIHELLGQEKAPPIYALTAHGMDEDREEFERAGMCGIVTKPFDRGDLYATVESTLKFGERRDSVVTVLNNDDASFDQYPEFDKAMVDDLLQTLDAESKQFLLAQCVADITSGLEHINEGIAANKIDDVAEAAHRLKSVAGTFGLTRIQHLANSVSELNREGRTGESMELAAELAAALPKGIETLCAVNNAPTKRESINGR